MAGTNGTLLGVFNGPTVFQAFNGENTPGVLSLAEGLDYFQIVQPGGAVLLQVKQSGDSVVVNTSPASWTKSAWLQQQMTAVQFRYLKNNFYPSPTAEQICFATFPNNNNLSGNTLKLDIFQVVSDIQSNSDGSSGHGQVSVPGGGGIIFRLDYAGAAHTS